MQATRRTAGVWPATGRKAAGPIDPDLAICVRGLAKHYRGNWTLRVARGLEELDLDVERGQVLGLLGPNGAGKSTTLKLLTGLLKPSSGNAWLLGVPIAEPGSRRPLGFLPEQPYFFDYLTGLECLELAGRLSGLSGREARERARHWLGRVGLGDRPRLRLRKFSKGMLQRLGLAAALVHDPEILILDEPMSGLDPYGRRDVRELILEQQARGVTVLFSSHILPDVEALANRVAILHRGRLVRTVESRDLAQGSPRGVVIRCEGAPIVEIPPAWRGRLTRHAGGADSEFQVSSGLEVNAVLDWLLKNGGRVRAVSPQGSGLEELFLAATAGDAPGPRDGAPRGERARARSGEPAARPESMAEPGSVLPAPERAASTLEDERRAA